MALPAEADQVVIQGIALDEVTGLGLAGTVTSAPVALTGQTAEPMVLDAASHAHIQTRARSTTPDATSGYWALMALATNDPDVEAYGGRRVTLPGQTPRVIEVPHNAPQVTVSAAMAAQINPQNVAGRPRVNDTVRAMWFHEAASYTPPTPASAYPTSQQVTSQIVSAVEAHDDDTGAHPDIRALAAAGSVADATTSAKGKTRLMGGTADEPTVPWALLTGKPFTWVTTMTGAAIQAAVTALGSAGGTIYLQAGTYALTAALTLPSKVTLQGQGMYATALSQATAGADAIAGTDLSHVAVRDLHLIGPNAARTSTTGSGINFGLSGTQGNATFYVDLRNLFIENFGLDGVFISTPIVSELSRVVVFKAGRHGINLVGNVGLESAGTSTHLKACFAAGCYGAGLRLKQMAYSSLTACAADANGVGYEYDTCTGITESGCGSEEPYNFTAKQSGYSGLSRRIINSKITLTSPYAIGNVGVAFQVGTNSQVVATNLFEGSPGNTDEPTNNPTASVKVDAGASVVLIKPSVVTAMNLAASTTTILPDAIGAGGGSSYTDEMAQDAAAQMILAGAHQGASAAYDDLAGALAILVTPPFLTAVGAWTHDAYGGTLANNQNTAALNGYLTPIRVHRTETWDRIAVICQTAGSAGALVRAGVHADDGFGSPTGAPLLDAGTVTATAAGTLLWTINAQRLPGLYHLVFKIEGSPTTPPKLQGFTTQAPGAAQPAATTGAGQFVTYGADGALGAIPAVGQASYRPVGSARVASRP